jgi:hypothetical protein
MSGQNGPKYAASCSIRKSTRARSALAAVLMLSVLIGCDSPTEITPFLEGAYVRMVDLHGQAAEWTMCAVTVFT